MGKPGISSDNGPVLIDNMSEDALGYALSAGSSCIIENFSENFTSAALDIISELPPSPSSLIICLSTRASYKLKIAEKISVHLHRKLQLPKEQAEKLLTIMNECILNSAIHGNLDIISTAGNMGSLFEYYQDIDKVLANREAAEKTVWLEISWDNEKIFFAAKDEGSGYNYQETVKALKGQKHRGLNIISSLAGGMEVSEGGTRISVWLSRKDIRTKNNIGREKIQAASLLIIEDDGMTRMLIKKILNNAGFENIHTAENAEIGLEKLKQINPDIVYLDIVMPGMDGFELCRKIREEVSADLPVIVQTSLSAPEERAGVFKAGATDLINKPVNTDELIARTVIHLEKKILLEDLQRFRSRMEYELQSAGEMQRAILPREKDIASIERNYNIAIASHFQASLEIGGDFWGVNAISGDEFAIYSVDFSGHGVTAALNSFRLHAIMQEYRMLEPYPDQYLMQLNEALCQLLSPGQFATMFYSVINTAENTLTYSAAGSPRPIIINHLKEGSIIDSSGLPLGIKKTATYDLKTMDFRAGGLLLLYSDALIETENPAGRFITEDDLQKLLIDNYCAEPKKILDTILSRPGYFYPENLRDDLTINLYYRNK